MTNIIEITATLSTPSLNEDEYLNESDGLVYCSKCHSARQTRKQLAGRTFAPYIMCNCQREAYEKEKAEREHEEFLIMISQLKSSGLQDRISENSSRKLSLYVINLIRCRAFMRKW